MYSTIRTDIQAYRDRTVRKSKRKLIETHSSIVVKLILLRLMGKRGLPHPRTLLQIWKNIMMSVSVENAMMYLSAISFRYHLLRICSILAMADNKWNKLRVATTSPSLYLFNKLQLSSSELENKIRFK